MTPGDTNDSTLHETMFVLEAEIAAGMARVAVLKLAQWACTEGGSAAAAFNEAIGLLQNVASLGSAVGPEPAIFPAIQGQAASLRELKYKTNDLVVIRGALAGEKTLQVSGCSPISLKQRSFLVLKVLAQHAHTHPGCFLSVNEIVKALLEDPARMNAEVWMDIVAEDVHRAIKDLRDGIEEAGGNPRLIERGEQYAMGYRLSTPQYNVFLEDLDVE